MSITLPSIDEFVRVPAPAPGAIGLVFDGTSLWVASCETNTVYAVDPAHGTIVERWLAPGTPYGVTTVGAELRVVVGDEPDDDRSIARFVPGHGFKTGSIPCPKRTGVWLAYDGEALFLGQRFNKRIIKLDEAGMVVREIPTEREITGMTFVDGCFYLMTTESKDVDDYRLTRLDLRGPQPVSKDLARVDFIARGLAFDGSRFWTNVRGEDTIVGFASPE